MHLRLAGAISTVIVIIVGFALLAPLFLGHQTIPAKPRIMLSFSVSESDHAVEWCKDLSFVLNKHNLAATVFMTGKVAQEYPQALTFFSDKIDIGSQTYNNVDLASISDYSVKLQEVEAGKSAVDNAAHIKSLVFQAPYGSTDQDIYSLLSRSNITADFSYNNQYNVWQDGKFLKFDAKVYDILTCSSEFINTLSKESTPIIITFKAPYDVFKIDNFLSNVDKDQFNLVNASELVGQALNLRGP